MPVHKRQFTIKASSQMPVHERPVHEMPVHKRLVRKRNAKVSWLLKGQKRFFMTISAKSCNRECPVTEIKELTSFFETSQGVRSRQLMYIVVAKDKKVGKLGDRATTFQCIAGPATFTWLGSNRPVLLGPVSLPPQPRISVWRSTVWNDRSRGSKTTSGGRSGTRSTCGKHVKETLS